MTIRMVAFFAGCVAFASQASAQYYQPLAPNNYLAPQQRAMSGVVIPNTAHGYGQSQQSMGYGQPGYGQGQPGYGPAGMRVAQNYPPITRASSRIRQDQAEITAPASMQPSMPVGDSVMQPRQMAAPMQSRVPIVEAHSQPRSTNLVPSMVAPSCGIDGASCGVDAGGTVGGDYFGGEHWEGSCGDSGCGGDACCNGRFVRAFGGWNWLQDMEIPFGTIALNQSSATFNDGWALGGAIGKYMTSNLRRELEFTYRNNTGNTLLTPAAIPLDGSVNCYSIMGNLSYELNRLNFAGFTPYAGGGIGLGFVQGDFAGASIDDTAFAYQGFGGVSRQISANAKLFAEYRYFETLDVEVTAVVPTETKYAANNVFVGFEIAR